MLTLPRSRLFWSVSLGHFTNDTFMSMGVVLLTFLSVSIIPMTNTEIGFAVSAQQLAGALSQPFFGILADRTGGRRYGAGGVAWVVTMFMSALLLAVLTRSYFLMLIPFVLQGLGSGAFHPVGALHAAESNQNRAASSTSYFFLAGQFGLALGPALIGALLDAANRDSLALFTAGIGLPGRVSLQANVFPIFWLAAAAIPAVFMMTTSIPIRTPAPRVPKTKTAGATSPARINILPFVILGVMVIIRGLAQPGSVNFIPSLFQAKGWSPSEYGIITSLFWLASGVAGVIFGSLADKYDRRTITMVSMVLSAPAFFLLPATDGLIAMLLAVAAGGLSGGSHSLLIVLAQEMMPAGKGFASGSMLGFIFASGAIGSLVIGKLADSIGLATTFQLVAVAAAVSGVMSLLLPKKSR